MIFVPKLDRMSHLMSAQGGFLSDAGSHKRFDERSTGLMPLLNGFGMLGRVGIFARTHDLSA